MKKSFKFTGNQKTGMTDRPRYQDSEMEGQEMIEYAHEELGDRFHEVQGSKIPNKVRDFLTDLADTQQYVRGYIHENGFVIKSVLQDQIINPKEVIGQKPRLALTQGKLVIYFKKEGDYYLIILDT